MLGIFGGVDGGVVGIRVVDGGGGVDGGVMSIRVGVGVVDVVDGTLGVVGIRVLGSCCLCWCSG